MKGHRTDIPRARELIKDAIGLCDDLEARVMLYEALGLMTRMVRPQPRRVARKVTSVVVAEVLHVIRREPHLTDHEIAVRLDINAGRVNEIRNGWRTLENPSMAEDGRNRRKG